MRTLFVVFALITLLLVGIGVAVRSRRGHENESSPEMVSFVFLMRKPALLDESKVKSAAEKAFGKLFNAENSEFVVKGAGRPGSFFVKTPQVALGVINSPTPYLENRGDAADNERVFKLKKALQDHKAWLSVDLVGDMPDGGESVVYQHIGKLLAEFATNDCLAIYSVATGQANSYEPDLLPLLRGSNPLAAFEHPREDPVGIVEDDDPRMIAAVAEARRRWPEFVTAFKAKRLRQGFAVKAPFIDGQEREFMWVEVSKIAGNKIEGELVNEPATVKNVKVHDKVRIRLEDLNDWIYSDGDKMVGGFTSELVEAATRRP